MRWALRMNPTAVLSQRNYRLLWSGNAISQFGDQMQFMAQNWLVWEITGSVTALGLAAFVAIIPRLLIGLFGGPLVDHHNRRRLLMFTQSVALIFALGFATAVFKKIITFELALFFIFTLECTQAVNATTRQSLVPEIIPREDIPSAVSLNSVSMNLARIIGPAFAGILIPITDVSGLMAINTFTFIVVIVSVKQMKIPLKSVTVNDKPSTYKHDLKEGYDYVWHNIKLRILIYLTFVSALLIMPFTSLLPAYVGIVLQKGPEYLGFLTAAFGAGAILGAFNGPSLRSTIGNKIILLAAIIQGCAFILFGLSTSFGFSVVIMFCLGLATMVYNNSVLTAIQLTASQEYLGRTMGIYIMNKAVTAIGALTLGMLASFMGVGPIFIVSGALYLALGAGVQYFNNKLINDSISPAVSKII